MFSVSFHSVHRHARCKFTNTIYCAGCLKNLFVSAAEGSGRTSLAILVLHQAAWRIICASPTKPYCLHFPHECFQMCSGSKSVKLLPGNKLCVGESCSVEDQKVCLCLCLHAHSESQWVLAEQITVILV